MVVEKEREKLSRDRVIAAALRVMDAEGLEAVTMRRVAREVGVEAMSLYHYVQDKDDLLGSVCGAVMADFRIPQDADTLDWFTLVRHGASEWRRVLRSHPNALALFADRHTDGHGAITDLEALRPMEFALDVISRAGIEPREAVQVFNVLGGYIMGFVVMEVGQMFSAGALDEDTQTHAKAAAAMASDELPRITACLPYLATCDPDEQFDFGLDLMLAGLKTRYRIPGDAVRIA